MSASSLAVMDIETSMHMTQSSVNFVPRFRLRIVIVEYLIKDFEFISLSHYWIPLVDLIETQSRDENETSQ